MSAYLSALVLLAVASVLGAGLLRACSRPAWSPLAPAAGLGVLVIASGALIRLPGDASMVAIVMGLVTAAAAVLVARGGGGRRPSAEVVVALAVVGLGTTVPFVTTGEIGLLGNGVNNDLGSHLAWAEALRDPGLTETLPIPPGYPVSPHALVAAVAQTLGVSMDMAFTGLLMAIPAAGALCALSLLSGLGRARRGVAAGLVALTYLSAAYYGQGAFKETLTAVLLLLFVAVLAEISRARRVGTGHVVLLLVATGGSFANYSYFGLAWIVLTLAFWTTAEALRRDGWLSVRGLRGSLVSAVGASRRSLLLTGMGLVGLAALLLPEFLRAFTFFEQISLSPTRSGVIDRAQLGNLFRELSPFEALGLWPTEDFRRYFDFPREAYKAGMAATLGMVALGMGLWWHLRRHSFAAPAAALAALVIYASLKGGESPYVTAKALAVPASILAVLVLRGVLDPGSAPPGGATALRRLAAVGVVAVAAWSSFLALRGAAVWPEGHRSELSSLRPLVQGKRVLYLASDEFAYWQLRGARVYEVGIHPSLGRFSRKAKRPYAVDRPADFDMLDAAGLDRFERVITPSGHYASEAPANFSLERRTRSFALWRRTGPTPKRFVLDEGTAPGAVLRCDRSSGRDLSRRRGWARVRPEPLSESGPAGDPLGTIDVEPLAPGGRTERTLFLPPGRYELSTTYSAPRPPRFRLEGREAFAPPAHTDRIGPRWPVGVFSWRGGRVTITIEAPALRLGARRQDSVVGRLHAVRLDQPAELVPLRAACGRYVDWYTLGAKRPPVPPI